MDEIVLSSNEFKALASDTRTQIIKLLQDRNYTLSEFASKLNLRAPTVKQHLEILQRASLVQQIDEGRKWKYYSLTRRGKGMFSESDSRQILIILAITLIGLFGLFYVFFGSIEASQAWFLAEEARSIAGAEAPQIAQATGNVLSKIGTETADVGEIRLPTISETALWAAAISLLSIALGYNIARLRKR